MIGRLFSTSSKFLVGLSRFYSTMAPIGAFSSKSKALEEINRLVATNPVLLFSKTTCPFCAKAKALLTEEYRAKYESIELDRLSEGEGQICQEALFEKTGQKTVPNIFIHGEHIGGNDSLQALHRAKGLQGKLDGFSTPGSALEGINQLVSSHAVVIFSKTTCPYCTKAKALLQEEYNVDVKVVELDQFPGNEGQIVQEALLQKTGQRTVPNIFIRGEHIGGNDSVQNLHKKNELLGRINSAGKLAPLEHGFEYDLIIVGGGSGGIACAKEASDLGARVALFDYVKPSPKGTVWGLGGTCVNVGCIPKKLFHQAAILGHSISDSQAFGWRSSSGSHDWSTLVTSVQSYIKSLNRSTEKTMADSGVKYFNEKAELVDEFTVRGTDGSGGFIRNVTAKNILISIGGRPRYPDIPGAREFAITSDDIFSLPVQPKNVLCVGASYIALETAGFLAGLGSNVTVMVRSILLRGFDEEVSKMIGEQMESIERISFIRGFVPTRMELNGQEISVYSEGPGGQKRTDIFDTVVMAIGRDPLTTDLKLDQVGVTLCPKTGKVVVDNGDRSSISSVFAIGDVALGRPELTPSAIQAGVLLARRLAGKSTEEMNYDFCPTTVFTPLEYGCIGLSETSAFELYGSADVEVFHSRVKPLEWAIAPHRKKESNMPYIKLVTIKSKDNRVIGFHYLGPNAGEVTQGFATAMLLGATKAHFDKTIGIHPTCAESLVKCRVVKGSGQSIEPDC